MTKIQYDANVGDWVERWHGSSKQQAGRPTLESMYKTVEEYIAAQGEEVTLNIPAELLSIGYGNPNAAVTAAWAIAHPWVCFIVGFELLQYLFNHAGQIFIIRIRGIKLLQDVRR